MVDSPFLSQCSHIGVVAWSGQEAGSEASQPELGPFQRPGIPVDTQHSFDPRLGLENSLGMASFPGGAVYIDPALVQLHLMEGLRQKHWLVKDNEFLMEFIG